MYKNGSIFICQWVFHYASLIGSPESVKNNETINKTNLNLEFNNPRTNEHTTCLKYHFCIVFYLLLCD
ncbi:hypothetical protein EB796_007481 [Bugula neritina]|uniref:Uncharacterized protein n=1 Tax=Bugula neritina TaxID=10212 RepID=A0A7J7K8Q1_BUGNE|nr:hypothetical protein EB796_007481 [Bugula neritina]